MSRLKKTPKNTEAKRVNYFLILGKFFHFPNSTICPIL
jgi:hypothetical protein